MPFVRILSTFLIVIGSATAAQRLEAERLLAASHVALVTVKEEVEGRGTWTDVDIKVDELIKGEWTQRVSIWMPERSVLAQGEKYVMFCSENATRYRGFILYAHWQDVVQVQQGSAKEVVTGLSRAAQSQRSDLRAALQAMVSDDRLSGEVPKILALLFHEDTQLEAVRKLLALPKEENRAIAMHVYDVRPIPRALFSPDSPIVFDRSPVADCGSVQEMVIWILGLRVSQSFGAMSEASTDKRSSIADAWFYWLIVRNGTKPSR